MHEATPPVIQMIGPLGRRDGWTNTNTECPVARTLDVVGARSAFLILREALYGSTRFEQFVGRAGISEPVAAARLRELTAEGLLEKIPYREPGQRTRHEYRLTQKLSLIHISEPTRLGMISYAVFCLKKKKKEDRA